MSPTGDEPTVTSFDNHKQLKRCNVPLVPGIVRDQLLNTINILLRDIPVLNGIWDYPNRVDFWDYRS